MKTEEWRATVNFLVSVYGSVSAVVREADRLTGHDTNATVRKIVAANCPPDYEPRHSVGEALRAMRAVFDLKSEVELTALKKMREEVDTRIRSIEIRDANRAAFSKK